MCNPFPTHKTCHQCNVTRAAGEYIPSPLTGDGHTDRCKPCNYGNAARDRSERETRRASRNERISTHV